MAQIRYSGWGEARAVAEQIDAAVMQSGISCERMGWAADRLGTVDVITAVYEKYYWRAGNRASLTVTVLGDGSDIRVHAVGSGGGQGALFRLSWGAEESFVGVVADLLEGMGFRRTE